MTLFAVTGATGPFGRTAIDRLIDRGVEPADVVAIVRTPARATDLAARGVQVRQGDYDAPLDEALAGVDRLLLVSGSEVGRRVPQHRNVVETAVRAGVSRIAYTSVLRAGETPLVIAPEHRATEEVLARSGIAHSLLRNTWYTENFTGALAAYTSGGAVTHAAGSRACHSSNPETRAKALAERAAGVAVPAGSDEDDDDPDEGGEVLAEEPPTKPLPRTPQRITLSPRVMIAMLPMLLLGCSPSALQTHATIASITGHVFDEACAEVEVARSREQHAIADGPLDREASIAAVETVRAHWAPALASCELAADTHDAWVTALALAAAGAPFTLADGIALAQSALSVWQSLTATLAVAGVGMPALPAELVALTGGAL